MFISTSEYRSRSWSEYTLVVPSVSVGNVGQLSVDILISTLDMVKVGHFHDDSFLPVLGNDPFSDSSTGSTCSIMTASQVFESSKYKIATVQQRSPLVKGKHKHFVDNLVEWIKVAGFKCVVILTSSHSHERIDSQLAGSQLRYLVSQNIKPAMISTKDNLYWIELEKRNTDDEIFLPGAGFAKLLYMKCCQANVDSALLVKFSSEGDNTMDGQELMVYLSRWLQLVTDKSLPSVIDTKLTLPPSWKLLFGNRVDQLLFR